jgi:hypothetical protein
MLLRALLLTAIIGLTTFLAAILQSTVIDTPATPINALVVFLTIWFPMILGLLASELPRGEEFIFIRMGGATFCRTGMPLLVILLLRYSIPDLVDQVVFMIVFVYAVGFIASVLLSVFRLGRSPGGQNLSEVQSAIH